MSKQNLPNYVAILALFLLIASGIAGACVKSQYNAPNVYKNVTVGEAKKMLENEDLFLLDVRTPAEYNYAHIEGATLIPLKNVPAHDPVNLSENKLLAKKLNELPKNKTTEILVYCLSGRRGADASQIIADAGYKEVYNMQDGIGAWVNASYPVVVDPNSWASNYPNVTTM
ncbi:MAG: hypothetical protein QG646_2558 [Euryarchaeota archaeon]|nr:hypothetical protein [Euryarchaeota archaeon]